MKPQRFHYYFYPFIYFHIIRSCLKFQMHFIGIFLFFRTIAENRKEDEKIIRTFVTDGLPYCKPMLSGCSRALTPSVSFPILLQVLTDTVKADERPLEFGSALGFFPLTHFLATVTVLPSFTLIVQRASTFLSWSFTNEKLIDSLIVAE